MYTVLRLLSRKIHSYRDVTIASKGLDNALHLRAVRREGSPLKPIQSDTRSVINNTTH